MGFLVKKYILKNVICVAQLNTVCKHKISRFKTLWTQFVDKPFDIFGLDTGNLIVYRRLTMKVINTSKKNIIDSHSEGRQVDTSQELAMLCKALAHPIRLRILQYLKEVDGCICGRIVEVLPLAQSTVSQHLKILKQAGLVRGEVEGPRTCYCLDKRKLARLKKLVNKL
jgi:ArsR family transcriptional regulator